MILLESASSIREWRKGLPKNQTVGFVPTMGALHAGHESLLKASREKNDLTVLSIFVNPTQFNNPDDFTHYPKTWDADRAMAEKNGVAAVFLPKNKDELYPDDYHYRMTETPFSQKLCGAFRPGHFDGVLSVVLKLFQLVKPDHAYFGEKDFQQLSLIQGMVKAYFIDVEVVPCETVREDSGLAMSSRNMRLTPNELKIAPLLYKTLKSSIDLEVSKKELNSQGFKVEYLEDVETPFGKRRFVAAHLGAVRLIDNVKL